MIDKEFIHMTACSHSFMSTLMPDLNSTVKENSDLLDDLSCLCFLKLGDVGYFVYR